MVDDEKRDDSPVEIFCPICGYTTVVKEADRGLEGLSRDEKIQAVKKLQQSDHPIVECSGCDDPKQTAHIMEVR